MDFVEPLKNFSHDFGGGGHAESEIAQTEADFKRGYETASVMALTVEQQIREAFPNQSNAFYRGVMDGIRQEL